MLSRSAERIVYRGEDAEAEHKRDLPHRHMRFSLSRPGIADVARSQQISKDLGGSCFVFLRRYRDFSDETLSEYFSNGYYKRTRPRLTLCGRHNGHDWIKWLDPGLLVVEANFARLDICKSDYRDHARYRPLSDADIANLAARSENNSPDAPSEDGSTADANVQDQNSPVDEHNDVDLQALRSTLLDVAADPADLSTTDLEKLPLRYQVLELYLDGNTIADIARLKKYGVYNTVNAHIDWCATRLGRKWLAVSQDRLPSMMRESIDDAGTGLHTLTARRTLDAVHDYFAAERRRLLMAKRTHSQKGQTAKPGVADSSSPIVSWDVRQRSFRRYLGTDRVLVQLVDALEFGTPIEVLAAMVAEPGAGDPQPRFAEAWPLLPEPLATHFDRLAEAYRDWAHAILMSPPTSGR